ncbi:hypothetical protein BJ988_004448 [Nocardioides panzhihuensis]|uniref:Uncharacterized protein n=1 Tax=Nocardioides panzhihuensis TaxID=860243 RepID=A0A7Z0DQK0_9ACTN|nr:hypothetical protein [Nocardioides panzhihuensis]
MNAQHSTTAPAAWSLTAAHERDPHARGSRQ